MGGTSGGTYVVISGANFIKGVAVSFGAMAATVKTESTGFIGVIAPAHAAGAVPVIVTNPSAPASPPLSFTYADAPPPDMTLVQDMTTQDFGALDLSTSRDLEGGGGGQGGHGGGGGGGQGGASPLAGVPPTPPLGFLGG